MFHLSVINRQQTLDQLWKRSNAFTSSPSAPQPTPAEKKRLFAVLIGINSYHTSFPAGEFPSLRGAVPDAIGFNLYLENVLGVPSDQIVLLTDEKATRSAIIGALKHLSEDERIESGDAILIYYAGHGTEMDPPANWESGGLNAKIQAIVPYDCDAMQMDQRVAPIPDRVLEVLLARIAEKKGNNITVIFDCCHSASGTRGVNKDDLSQARFVKLPPRLYPENLDSDILDSDSNPRGAYVPSGFRHRGLGSHVLLAACSATKLAMERNGHGRFSSSLLKLLNQVSPDKLRYSDILQNSVFNDIKEQDPQCEGLHVDRILFDAKVLPARRKSFPVSYKHSANGHGHFVVHGGTIHNIMPDFEFAIYRESDVQLANQIGILCVDKLGPFSFTAKLYPGARGFDLTHPTIAIQRNPRKGQDLWIFVPVDDGFRHIYHRLAKARILQQDVESIFLVDEPQGAHVEMCSTGENAIKVTVCTPTAGNVASHKCSHVVDVGDPAVMAGILVRMAHYYREFRCTDNDPEISRYISIEFYQLRTIYDIDVDTGLQEERLEPIGPNLYVNGRVTVTVPKGDVEDIPYGLKLTNRSRDNLHVNIFYFNNSDLSISPCVKSHTSYSDHALDVPLKKRGGSLAIGYGAAGYQPISFEITNGLHIDVGFLKIYLSTQPVNLVHLQQPSPFSSTRAVKDYHRRPKVSWTDIAIPIIQQR